MCKTALRWRPRTCKEERRLRRGLVVARDLQLGRAAPAGRVGRQAGGQGAGQTREQSTQHERGSMQGSGGYAVEERCLCEDLPSPPGCCQCSRPPPCNPLPSLPAQAPHPTNAVA